MEGQHRAHRETPYPVERGDVLQRRNGHVGMTGAHGVLHIPSPRDIREIVPPRQTCIQHRHCAGNH